VRTISASLLTIPGAFAFDPTLFEALSPQKFAPAVIPFLAALAATAIAVLPARWLSFRLGAVSEPGGRHIHAAPIGRLGGLAMYVGFGLSAALYSTNRATLGLLLSAAVVTSLMVLDDVHGMPPILKLASQIAASLLAIVVFGFEINYVSLPSGVVTFAPWAAVIVSLLWFVGLQNTINLIDGVDGLAAGVVAIVAGAILLAAINQLRPDIVILAGALIGACVGFLLFNWYPARIIMGDAGSHFLGFTLAAISVLSVAKGAVVLSLAVPLLALAIPIVDTGWAILRRRIRGQSIAAADAEHLHHRLLDIGLSPPETALLFYLGTAIFAAVGLTIYGHKKVLLGAMILALIAIAAIVRRATRRSGRS
jgi:UDP-GlcNAc:undecaprenyl-phosphate/decaprenyl-phosphate GlcNAc-1-phosphate transferase